MNIWYLNPYAGGPGMGKAYRAFHLARSWAKLGHTTTVFPVRFHHLLDRAGELPAETTVDSVRYVSLPGRRYEGNGFGRLLNMADYCRAVSSLGGTGEARFGRPDAVIVSSPHPLHIYPGARLAKRFDAKLVFEVRDLWPLSIVEILGAASWHPLVVLTGFAERYAYRRADLVASQMVAAEPYMRERGLPPGRFVAVPNGITNDSSGDATPPVSKSGRTAATLLAEWNKNDRLVVIHPGSQGPPNALDRLLDAVSLLKAKGLENRIGVLLLGRGVDTDALKAKAAGLGLESVAFADPVPKTEALWLTARADVGYAGARDHWRLYRYGINFNKITDFMQAGLPVLLPLRAQGEPVSASGCGIVTSSAPEAIAAALERFVGMSPAERREMGERGRDYAHRELDYHTIGKRYIDAIAATPRRS